MPRRPRQHVIEDLARTKLHAIFSGVGWTAEDVSKDYGEDLVVRIFDDGQPTPWTFFVQSKATDNLSRYLTRDGGTIHFPIRASHLVHWHRFWEPVFLTVWDSQSGNTYWGYVQRILESDSKHHAKAFE